MSIIISCMVNGHVGKQDTENKSVDSFAGLPVAKMIINFVNQDFTSEDRRSK